jgi:hypothetical protein
MGLASVVRVEGAPGSAGRTESTSRATVLSCWGDLSARRQPRTWTALWGDTVSTSMPSHLPPRPDLAQLRRLAKELTAAARAGQPGALDRIRAHAPATGLVTLSVAQLVIAREHGFASWPRLKAHVEASDLDLLRRVEAFLDGCLVGLRPAAFDRLLAADPRIAGYDFRTAVVLGDATRVRELLIRDPALATSAWQPLFRACRAGWNDDQRTRANGLTEVARLLLDAGADPAGTVSVDGLRPSSVLTEAVASRNPALTRLLLERGARPDAAAFNAAGEPGCLRALLDHAPLPAGSSACSTAMFFGQAEMVRLLLEAGADANRPLPGAGFRADPDEMYDEDHVPDDTPVHPLLAAILIEAPIELFEALVEHGSREPSAAATAVLYGRRDVAELLTRHQEGRSKRGRRSWMSR